MSTATSLFEFFLNGNATGIFLPAFGREEDGLFWYRELLDLPGGTSLVRIEIGLLPTHPMFSQSAVWPYFNVK
jgi:hypothetical protein